MQTWETPTSTSRRTGTGCRTTGRSVCDRQRESHLGLSSRSKRDVAIETNDDQPPEASGTASRNTAAVQRESTALVEAIKRRIMVRTSGRIQSLEVEQMGSEVIIRGSTPCYYIKRLVLQGVLDVMNSDPQTQVGLNVQVVVCLPASAQGARLGS